METIYNNLLIFTKALEKHWWDYGTTQTAYTNLINSINNFRVVGDVNQVKNSNMFIIYRIYETLLGKYSDIYIPYRMKTVIRNNVINKFFGKLNIRSYRWFFLSLPTTVFNSFVKGITYFDSDDNTLESPNYHRLASCQSSRVPMEDKVQNVQDPTFIKTCYIERLIYNELYNHYLHHQDINHMHELYKTEKYYFQFFPNETVNISINYDINHYPYQLIINFTIDGIVSVETYTKNWDEQTVMCQLLKFGEFKYKRNTFQTDAEWTNVRIEGNTNFGSRIRSIRKIFANAEKAAKRSISINRYR
jgi:hypothetical protein